MLGDLVDDGLQFKKAPSNRGLRQNSGELVRHLGIIQKSPIKSGIKTASLECPAPLAKIQKSPIKSGIKTAPDNSEKSKYVNSKKPHQIGD